MKEWDCRLCGKGLAEPRVLACLHSFCTRCLQDLPQDGAVDVWAEDGGKSTDHEPVTDSKLVSGDGLATCIEHFPNVTFGRANGLDIFEDLVIPTYHF